MSCSNQLFKAILIISFFLAFTGTATADDLGIINALSDGFVQGFNNVLYSVTNQMYETMGMNSTDSETMITNFMVQPDDFLNNNFVQKEKTFTAFWYAVFYVIFLLVGGIILMKEEAMPAHGFGMGGPAWRNTYIAIALIAPLVWAFYLYGLKWMFSLEYVLSKSSYLEIMDFMPPTSDNAVEYVILGLLRIINIVFFYIRYMVAGLIAAWFLFVIAARFIPITASYGKLLINYFLLMLFSRFVVILILAAGFGIVAGLPFISMVGEFGFAPYMIVLLLALLFELGCILYPIIFVFFHSPVKYVKFR
jgi:hypothetical protein